MLCIIGAAKLTLKGLYAADLTRHGRCLIKRVKAPCKGLLVSFEFLLKQIIYHQGTEV